MIFQHAIDPPAHAFDIGDEVELVDQIGKEFGREIITLISNGVVTTSSGRTWTLAGQRYQNGQILPHPTIRYCPPGFR